MEYNPNKNYKMINEANKVMEAKMKEYVEKGIIKEQLEEQQKIETPKGAKMNVVRK